jgi:DNA polymerase-3 subunit epsilon
VTVSARQIVLDTETTGLEPEDGHRVIELGCVEMVNRRPTGRTFHQYLNPHRTIDPGAVEVHGLTNEFLADKPAFEDVVDEFLEFVEGAELVIHNAPFDVGFLDHELRLSGKKQSMGGVCRVLDTLVMARQRHPGQRNSLDALCKRYDVDNSRRELHGALLDAQILADVYLIMTGGQAALSLDTASGDATESQTQRRAERPPGVELVVLRAGEDERRRHDDCLDRLDQALGEACAWRRLGL